MVFDLTRGPIVSQPHETLDRPFGFTGGLTGERINTNKNQRMDLSRESAADGASRVTTQVKRGKQGKQLVFLFGLRDHTDPSDLLPLGTPEVGSHESVGYLS